MRNLETIDIGHDDGRTTIRLRIKKKKQKQNYYNYFNKLFRTRLEYARSNEFFGFSFRPKYT